MTSVCRQSDSAFVQYQNGVSGDLGLIAKTSAPNNGSLDITGNFQIVGEGSAISGTVNKVGRTTGWTQGTITFSCVNVGVSGTNIVQLCQNIVESTSQIVAGGDSGSAVFTIGSGDNVVLEGILWGSFTGGLGFVYSPIANIESELGALTTSGGGSPPPTPTATSPAPTATATQTPTPNPGGNPATMANDDFESNSFNGGSGWLASWATSGNFNIDEGSSSDPHNGSFHLRLRATSNASRSVDVSGASSVRVEFWAKLESFESSDTAQVLVNGNVIQAFANGDDDGIYRFYSIDVTPYLSGSTLDLEFDGTMSSSFDRFFVDDVTIISDAGGSPPPESTETPTPPPSTSTPTATPPPNTATPTATPPPNTATPTATPPPSTATPTATLPPSTATATATPPPSTATPTATPPPNTATPTATPIPGGGPVTLASDNFESGGFGGGSGWLAAWVTSETFDIDDGSSSSPHNGGFHLLLRATSNALRSVDVSGASSVRIEFWAKLESFESSDTAQVLVNGNVIQAFANGDDDGIYRFYSIDVTPYLSGSTLDLEFDGTMSSSFDRFFVDDVTIIADAGGSPPPQQTATPTVTSTPGPGGSPTTLASEDLESNSFGGGSGWLASWATSGNLNIDDGSSSSPHNGGFHLRLRATSNAIRSVDVSGASSVRVEFWAKLESFESSDTAQVLVNGNIIQAFANGDDDGVYRFYSIDVTPYLSGSTLDLEFDGTMSSSFDRFFVDDIAVISE